MGSEMCIRDSATLCLVTDGITEAEAGGRELGMGGLSSLLQRMSGKTATEKLDATIRLFVDGRLVTHDDATMLLVTASNAGGVNGR